MTEDEHAGPEGAPIVIENNFGATLEPMRFCPEHWEELRTEIKERGLWDLVGDNSETMQAQIKDQAKRKEYTLLNMDPLLTAHNLIFKNALQVAGLELLSCGGCPICYLITHASEHVDEGYTPEYFAAWPSEAAEGMRIAVDTLKEQQEE